MLPYFASRVHAPNFRTPLLPTFYLPSHFSQARRGFWVASTSFLPSSKLLENQGPATITSTGLTAEDHPSLGDANCRDWEAAKPQPSLPLPRAFIYGHICLPNWLQAHFWKGRLRPKQLQEEAKLLADYHLGYQFTPVLAVTRLWLGTHDADTRAQLISDEIRPQGNLSFLLLGAVLTLGVPILFMFVPSDKCVGMVKRCPRPVWRSSWKSCAKYVRDTMLTTLGGLGRS